LWRPDVTVWPQKMLICWPSWPKTCRRSICILYSYILCFVNKIYITHIIGSSYDVELEFACILIKFYTVAWLIDWLIGLPPPFSSWKAESYNTAVVSSIAILFKQKYRDTFYRYRPALVATMDTFKSIEYV
jgi:hypothetical protein